MVRSTRPPSSPSRFNNHITAPVPRISDKPRPSSHRINLKWAKLSRVYDHLYLGGAIALNSRVIYENRINFIINATVEAPSVFLNGVETMKLWVADTAETDLSPHFDTVADLIHYVHHEGGRVLVHCLAGVSRSTALVLAYLVKYHRMSLREAYQFLASVRPVVRPSANFWHQLIAYEMRVRNVSRSSVRFVAVPGSDQSLPDVYMVTLEEEDEDVDTPEGPAPPQPTNQGTSSYSSPFVSKEKRHSADSMTQISEEDEKARDSGLDTEYDDASVNDVPEVTTVRSHQRRHHSSCTTDTDDVDASVTSLDAYASLPPPQACERRKHSSCGMDSGDESLGSTDFA